MTETAVDIAPRAASSETADFDFAGEFKRRLETAPDYQGPERESVLHGLEAAGISEVRKLVPAFMFEGKHEGKDSDGRLVVRRTIDIFIGDVEELEGKMDPYHFGIVQRVRDDGYVLTDGAGESCFLVTSHVGVLLMSNNLQEQEPRASESWARLYKGLLERYGLKTLVAKINSGGDDLGEWDGGEARVLVDNTPLPPVLSKAERYIMDNGRTKDETSPANVAVGYIKEHYPEATNTEVIRFVSTVRSRMEAWRTLNDKGEPVHRGIPVDLKKILEELKAEKE